MTDAAGVDHEWIGVTTFYFTVIDFFFNTLQKQNLAVFCRAELALHVGQKQIALNTCAI